MKQRNNSYIRYAKIEAMKQAPYFMFYILLIILQYIRIQTSARQTFNCSWSVAWLAQGQEVEAEREVEAMNQLTAQRLQVVEQTSSKHVARGCKTCSSPVQVGVGVGVAHVHYAAAPKRQLFICLQQHELQQEFARETEH